jgi:conjugal transfer pilus assembly protein TraK
MIKSNRKFLFPLLFGMSLIILPIYPIQGLAKQEFKVKDGDTIAVKISSYELTRIAIHGKGRLEKVWGAVGGLEIKPDKENGEIFVQPKEGSPASISFFVRDDLGATYTLIAQQQDIPSETILLKQVSTQKSKLKNGEHKITPFVESIKHLIKGMALESGLDDSYIINDLDVEVPLWKETKITLNQSYSSDALLGEIYTVENISDADMILHEREFLNFRSNVQAVALENQALKKGGSTLLYIVSLPVGDR